VTGRYRLLWVDFKISTEDDDVIGAFDGIFEIHQFMAISSLDREIERVDPAIICFDFDFPTKPALKMLQDTKKAHASIPVLMLTVQHSEALAVWAFRSRVWDYLVKPIAKRELDRCLDGLSEMLQMRASQTQKRAAANAISLIPEESRWGGARGNSPTVLAPAIEYVESNFRDKLSSTDAARLCNLTTFQLSRLFKETYGLTFQDYILRFRIREACRLLKNPAAEVGDVASLVGFNDPSYFGKVFRRYMHCSPSQFHSAGDDALDEDLLSADLNDTASHPR
jgi:YesN/AraC family two-component response regulator